MRYQEPTEHDARFAEDVFSSDTWRADDGLWMERIYNAIPDGYTSSTRYLPAYTTTVDGAMEIKEEIFSRLGIEMRAHISNPAAMAAEARVLNGRAQYRPSAALLNEIKQSQWDVIGQERIALTDLLSPAYNDEPAGHIYQVGTDEWSEYSVLYVGQTVRGVAQRIRQHISARTPIGVRIRTGLAIKETLFVDVISIQAHGYNSLNAAERQYIETFNPAFNSTFKDI